MKLEVKTKVPIAFTRNAKEYEGTFISFEGLEEEEHFAIALGNWENVEVPLVRIHSECMTGDVFGSMRCDCGDQLSEAIQLTSEKGGLVLYLRQEGRGIGLYNKFKAYNLQDQGYDTYEANQILGFGHDMRNFDVAAEMLKALDMTKIILHSNNREKHRQLTENDIEIIEGKNTGVYANPINRKYLLTKKEKGHHSINIKSEN